MEITCPQCRYRKEVAAASIPVIGSATCPRCGCRFPLGRESTIPGHEGDSKSGRSKGNAIVVDASVLFLLVGYLLFGISLFQPSVSVGWHGNDVLLGYHALLASPALAMAVLIGGSDSVFHIVVGILVPICNLYVFASYWLYRYYKRSRDNTLLLGAAVFAAAAWSYPAHAERLPPIAGVGYYLWASSITFISVSLLLLAVKGEKK